MHESSLKRIIKDDKEGKCVTIDIFGGISVEVFTDYVARINNPQHRARTEEVLGWVTQRYPNLMPKIAWNQPMFTDHGTFIIGFSVAKHHLAVAPERVAIDHFSYLNKSKLTAITIIPQTEP